MITMALMGKIRRLYLRDRLSINEIGRRTSHEPVTQHDQEVAEGAGSCGAEIPTP